MASNRVRSVIQGLLATGACFAAGGVFAATPVADEVHSWNIPAEDGVSAVRDFGLQSGVAISAVQADLQGKRLNAVTGNLSVDAALRQLIAGTGLKYVYDASGRAITLSTASPAKQNPTPSATVPREPSTASSADPPRHAAILLEEIVVTARKREENVQDVPIAADVISGQTIERLNLNSLQDAAQTTPSIHVNSSGSGGQLYIRGTGSGTSQTFDQTVGTFIDDIYHGRSRFADQAFLDLDRVEILKGPQSTFFGNNAIAGAFNIQTAKPTTDSFSANVRALYGQFGQYAGEGALNLPAGETFAVRIAAIGDGLSGWQKNPFAGHNQPDDNNKAGRVTFLFRPSDNFDAFLKIEGGDNHDSNGSQIADCPPPAPFTPALFCATALKNGYPTGLNSHENTTGAGQGITLSTFEDVLTMHYHLGDQTLTSVTGFYNYHYVENDDLDGTPQQLFTLQIPEKYHQFSQELRIASPQGQTLEYLGGLYFQLDRLDGDAGDLHYYFLSPTINPPPPPPGTTPKPNPFAALVPYLPLAGTTQNNGIYAQDEHSYAVFGSLGWNVTDALKLSAGVRGSWVYKTASAESFFGTAGPQVYGGLTPLPAALQALVINGLHQAPPSTPWSSSRSDNAVQPSATIQYKFTPDAMLYASYSRGFLAGIPTGGFITLATQTTGTPISTPAPPLLPEHVNAYEAGIKSKWFDQRLLLNLDVFRSDYTNLQESSAIFNSAGSPVSENTNAGSSRSEGVEFQADWLVSRAFRLETGLTYLDSHFITFNNVQLNGIQTFCRANYKTNPACLQLFPGGIPGGTTGFQSLSGQPTNFAPKWSGNLAATYTISLPRNLHFVTEADVFASTNYFFANNITNDPELVQSGYARVDGRFSLEGPDQKWAVDILFKNVTDKEIVAGGTGGTGLPASTGSTIIRTEQPRNFALQARYRW